MLKNMIEALIFAAANGISYATIKDAFGGEYTEKEIKTALQEIRQEHSGNKGVILIEFNNNFQFQSNPIFSERLADILRTVKEKQLTSTALQTLAIIAYRQPITRSEIEEIRGGISSDYAIGVLIKAELIKPVGRKETVGRPLLYGTTDNFLKRFQLPSLDALPDYSELMETIRHSDKYNQRGSNLYEIRNKDLYSTGESDLFYEDSEDAPEFLRGEDIIVVDSDDEHP